jgi:hypothetical protein
MSEPITGGCLCGQVTYTIATQPKLNIVCHCRRCQKQTGSAFSTGALVAKTDIEINGNAKTYTETSDAGNPIKRTFCPNCGASLYSEVAARPDDLVVQAGSLDDPHWFKPRANFWTDSAMPWVAIDPECKNFPQEAG